MYATGAALSTGLKRNFADVTVAEVDCPDLMAAPFHLAGSGLSGSKTIVEVGGPPFLLPLVDRTKLYDFVNIARKVLPNAKSVFLCGAGAGPHPLIGSNCEVCVHDVFTSLSNMFTEILIFVDGKIHCRAFSI